MAMKTVHVLFILAALLGLLYVGHMLMSHRGSQILPGVGIGH